MIIKTSFVQILFKQHKQHIYIDSVFKHFFRRKINYLNGRNLKRISEVSRYQNDCCKYKIPTTVWFAIVSAHSIVCVCARARSCPLTHSHARMVSKDLKLWIKLSFKLGMEASNFICQTNVEIKLSFVIFWIVNIKKKHRIYSPSTFLSKRQTLCCIFCRIQNVYYKYVVVNFLVSAGYVCARVDFWIQYTSSNNRNSNCSYLVCVTVFDWRNWASYARLMEFLNDIFQWQTWKFPKRR